VERKHERIDNQIRLILVVGSAASENITVTLGDEVHVIVVESKGHEEGHSSELLCTVMCSFLP
jgi:hypothetical protein